MRIHETKYRDELNVEAEIDVRFFTRRGDVTDYTVVLLAEEGGAWRAVRVYDNAHNVNDMHRYNREDEKQPAEMFHSGTASEALRSAIKTVRDGYSEMIDSWRG
ncbi:MAG: hypothetical protein WB998_08165 [Solirubrobacteraceae bacterium]